MVVREVVRVLSGERAEPHPLKGSRECRHIHRHSRYASLTSWSWRPSTFLAPEKATNALKGSSRSVMIPLMAW